MFKEKLRDFVCSLNYIPNELRRQEIFLDVNRNKISIKLNGNIVIKEKHKWHEYTLKTFFLKDRLSKCQEKEIIENINDYLLFKKLADKILGAKDIIHCKNAEIRRLLLERFGYEKFLEELKGIIIHEDGTSKLIKLGWHEKEEPIKLVKVKDASTNRWYILRVPSNVKTCREAIAWTFKLKEEEYNPLKET